MSGGIVYALPPRRREAFLWQACGLEDRAVAALMGVAPSTVRFHLMLTRQSLGAASTAHAVAIALTTGVITLGEMREALERAW